MAEARVYLTEGFSSDHVIVRINGKKVFDKEGVTTKALYGLADEVAPVTLSGNHAKIEVELPQKKLHTTIDVDLGKGEHIPVSIEGGRLIHSIEKRLGFA